MDWIQLLDDQILRWIEQHMQGALLTPAMYFFTWIGELGAVWILLALVLLFLPKCRKTGIQLLLALLLCLLIGNLLLKPLIGRIRPCNIDMLREMLIARPQDFSFPSGHTLSSFAAATVLFLSNKKWGILALAAAACIAFSRLYFYVHYPTDVLAGLLLGILLGILAARFVDWIASGLTRRKQRKDNGRNGR